MSDESISHILLGSAENVYHRSILDAAQKCVIWLYRSEIRVSNPKSPCYGGYFNYYDAKRNIFPMIYLEITGYAVQFWIRLYEKTKKDQFLHIAKDSADFLVKSIGLKSKEEFPVAFPYGFNMPGIHRIERYFTFDNAICISALVDLCQTTGLNSYGEKAIEAGQWLLDLQKSDGSFPALNDLQHNNSIDLPRIEFWFGDSSSLSAKNAIALLKLHQMTGDKAFLKAAVKLLNWVLKQQNEDGSFRANADYNFTFTHSQCYVLEALLYCSQTLQREDIFHAVKSGGNWLRQVQNKDGSFFKYYGRDLQVYFRQIPKSQKLINIFCIPRDTGPTAQAARIWILLYRMTGEKTFYLSAQKAIKYLIALQTLSYNIPNTHGGFPNSSRKAFGRYWESTIYSSWEAMFACQAFMMSLNKDRDTGIDDIKYIF